MSICFCARRSDAAAEAGVETAERSRGRGLAARATAGWASAVRASGRVSLQHLVEQPRIARRGAQVRPCGQTRATGASPEPSDRPGHDAVVESTLARGARLRGRPAAGTRDAHGAAGPCWGVGRPRAANPRSPKGERRAKPHLAEPIRRLARPGRGRCLGWAACWGSLTGATYATARPTPTGPRRASLSTLGSRMRGGSAGGSRGSRALAVLEARAPSGQRSGPAAAVRGPWP